LAQAATAKPIKERCQIAKAEYRHRGKGKQHWVHQWCAVLSRTSYQKQYGAAARFIKLMLFAT
jgi:hypothetical protein